MCRVLWLRATRTGCPTSPWNTRGPHLQHWLDASERPDEELIARLGTALAHAVHSLHQQNACHLDLKPGNVLFTHGTMPCCWTLACRARRTSRPAGRRAAQAVGSPAWMAPEQVVGVRGDPRSDIFAIGVMLYELATGELPFGAPTTTGGCASACGWPRPPRKHRPDLAPWLQEIILRCLEPEAARRYPRPPTWPWTWPTPPRCASPSEGTAPRHAVRTHFKRWLRAAGMHYQPSPLPFAADRGDPIVMVAVPHSDVTDATLYSLREAVALSLASGRGAAGLRHGAVALGQQHQRQRPAAKPPCTASTTPACASGHSRWT